MELRQGLWRQKTRVPGLLYGIVYMMTSLAVLVELWLVTDGTSPHCMP